MKFTTGKAPIPENRAGRSSDFRKALAALPVGDDYIEVLLEDAKSKTLGNLQRAISVTAMRQFGKGNYTTRQNIDRTGFRIWRTAQPQQSQ